MTNLHAILCGLLCMGAGSDHTSKLIVEGARKQLAVPADYTPGYFQLSYPGGDLPANKGVCTDVVVRALRNAGYDLQKLIHQDMRKRFSRYPRREQKPDSNIDHRRVPNLIFYFKSYGEKLPTAATAQTLGKWRPGDIVFWKLDSGLDHCGVLSDRKDAKGLPLVIHNINRTAEEDVLLRWKVVGHYRFPKKG